MKTFMKHPTMSLLLSLQRELLNNLKTSVCFFPALEREVFSSCSVSSFAYVQFLVSLRV